MISGFIVRFIYEGRGEDLTPLYSLLVMSDVIRDLIMTDAEVDESAEKTQELILEMRLAKNILLKGIQSAD